MGTKLDAAKICMNSGCHMFLANGKKDFPLNRMIKDKSFTHFKNVEYLKSEGVMNNNDSITFQNTVMLDGSPTTNIAEIKRVY